MKCALKEAGFPYLIFPGGAYAPPQFVGATAQDLSDRKRKLYAVSSDTPIVWVVHPARISHSTRVYEASCGNNVRCIIGRERLLVIAETVEMPRVAAPSYPEDQPCYIFPGSTY